MPVSRNQVTVMVSFSASGSSSSDPPTVSVMPMPFARAISYAASALPNRSIATSKTLCLSETVALIPALLSH